MNVGFQQATPLKSTKSPAFKGVISFPNVISEVNPLFEVNIKKLTADSAIKQKLYQAGGRIAFYFPKKFWSEEQQLAKLAQNQFNTTDPTILLYEPNWPIAGYNSLK